MLTHRVMGLDVGDKTIGVAMSDLLGLTAQGIEVIARKNLKQDIARLRTLIEQHNVGHIVVGLPRSLNNKLGPQAEKVQEFVAYMHKSINLPSDYIDERFTTSIAERSLIEVDMSRIKRKQIIDKVAAQIILQSYLDRMQRTSKG
ncbi:MAG: Holliday junction resolvase RuvX [Bacillota bacterium]|nr:Holliday junction resolvase RuvX [Bacillota bacterium]